MQRRLFNRMQKYTSTGLLFLGLLLLTACSHPPPSAQPEASLPDSFSASGTSEPPAEWWTAFEDSQLNRLMDLSLRENFDLLLAWERLQAARALLRREASSKWPALDGRLQGQVQDPEPGSGNSFEAGLSTSYEVDLWGRIQSRVDAERYRSIATAADYQTALLTLSAEIALTYLEFLTAGSQLELIRSQLETNRKIYGSLEGRFAAGQGERADLLRQAQLVEATTSQMYMAEAEVQLLKNQLAVLAGQVPGQLELDDVPPLPKLPDIPQTGLPAELIQRRPDVRGNYNRLKAADEDLATAVSESYPRISISASLTTEENDFSDIFEDWVSSLAGNLLMPLFDGSRRKSEVERSLALRNQRLYAYSQSVLTAVREVEDALILESRQSQRLDSLQQQVRLAREAQQQLQLQYINGASDFLDVLTALTNEQRLRRDLLSARLDLYETRIALYRAIAGPVNTSIQTQVNEG